MPFTSADRLPGGQNMAAFLDMLSFSEGTSTSPATTSNGYDVIVTGIDGKPETFTDFSTHPFARGRSSKVINSRGLTSNAAGRYQHMLKDYGHYRVLLKLPDFGPASQDRWAVQLIRERGALPDIQAGRLRAAIAKCKNIWASLPGAGYGQPEQKFEALRAHYLLCGGSEGGV
ncbi:glycoside hydrolase family 104 protein [Ralstonia pseudosolanacearum]|uniref:glycoside hydrolase family 24 protein n=1 Tax=Ralstonia pseudosolanacearum TaxID=1310165 RepID=UPI003CEFF48D